MDKISGLISELERRGRDAPTLAEGQRLFMEAARLRREQTATPKDRFATPLPRN